MFWSLKHGYIRVACTFARASIFSFRIMGAPEGGLLPKTLDPYLSLISKLIALKLDTVLPLDCPQDRLVLYISISISDHGSSGKGVTPWNFGSIFLLIPYLPANGLRFFFDFEWGKLQGGFPQISPCNFREYEIESAWVRISVWTTTARDDRHWRPLVVYKVEACGGTRT